MAKINMSFDTVEKTLSVDVDGTKVSLVDGVSLYKIYNDIDESDKWEISMTLKPSLNDGMRIMTYVSANTK